VRRVPVAHGATEKKSPAAARYRGTKIPVPSCGIRGVPLFGRNAMKANLLDNVLVFTCIAAFITGITIAAVTLFGWGGVGLGEAPGPYQIDGRTGGAHYVFFWRGASVALTGCDPWGAGAHPRATITHVPARTFPGRGAGAQKRSTATAPLCYG